MKLSLYNITKDIGEQMLVYNTLSRALISIRSDEYKDLRNGIVHNKDTEILLSESGIVVGDSVDEFALYNYWVNTKITQKECLVLTFLVTYRCNFKCFYCYQGADNDKSETQISLDLTLKMIWKVICKSESRYVDFTFFGGEPLIDFKTLLKTSYFLNDIAYKRKIKIDLSVVTNGYLLDEEKAIMLHNAGVTTYQITIDGMESMHNYRRPHKTKDDSFNVIVKNINFLLNAFEKPPQIILNLNYDKSNFQDIILFLNDSPIDLSKVKVKFNPIKMTSKNCGKIECFEDLELAHIGRELINTASRLLGDQSLNLSEYGPCLNKMHKSIIVDRFGNLQKCIFGIGTESNIMGNINKDSVKELLNRGALDNLSYDQECLNCSVLPLCMGGCQRGAVKKMKSQCNKAAIFESLVNPIFDAAICNELNE